MHADFIPVHEVARACKISKPTAIARLRAGRIPGRTVRHGIARVRRDVFLKWLKEHGN